MGRILAISAGVLIALVAVAAWANSADSEVRFVDAFILYGLMLPVIPLAAILLGVGILLVWRDGSR